jgi:hypothetical protein
MNIQTVLKREHLENFGVASRMFWTNAFLSVLKLSKF